MNETWRSHFHPPRLVTSLRACCSTRRKQDESFSKSLQIMISTERGALLHSCYCPITKHVSSSPRTSNVWGMRQAVLLHKFFVTLACAHTDEAYQSIHTSSFSDYSFF